MVVYRKQNALLGNQFVSGQHISLGWWNCSVLITRDDIACLGKVIWGISNWQNYSHNLCRHALLGSPRKI
jgi:hypothetical protein